MKEKIKISSHVKSAIKEVIKDFFIIGFILTVPLFVWLKVGICIENLHFKNYFIDGLYIKLDKKLTLKANKVVIPKNKAKPSLKNLDKTFSRVKHILEYFDYIELNNIKFNNNNLKIIYMNKIFYIETKDYSLSAIVDKKSNMIYADIPAMHINKANLNMICKISYDFNKDILDANGKFFFRDAKGVFHLLKEKNNIAILVSSGTFNDIAHILKPWNIPQKIYQWLVHKVVAKEYRLEYFTINAFFDKKDNLVFDFGNINAKAVLNDVNILFKNGLDTIKADRLDISYTKNSLYFEMIKPRYRDIDLNNSKISIDNIIGDNNSILSIQLHILSVLNSSIQEVLKAYSLKLPLKSTKKHSIDLSIKIPLNIESKVNISLESNLSKDTIYINSIPIDIEQGKIIFKNNQLLLNDFKLKNKIYNINLKGNANILTKKIELKSYIKKLTIKDSDGKLLILLKNKKIPIYISYLKRLSIELPTLKTNIKVLKNNIFKVYIYKVSKLLPFFNNLPIDIIDGYLSIKTKDFKKYEFIGDLIWNNCFFYLKKDSCLSKMDIKGIYQEGNFKIRLFKNRVYLDTAKSIFKLKNINIDLEKFLKAKKSKNSSKKSIYIYGNNSTIRYRNSYLITDSYDIVVYPNGNIKAMGSLDKDVVKFDKVGKNISIKAYRVKDKMLHPLINFDGLKNGRYTFKLNGDPDGELKGEILVEGGVLKDFKAYNNTLAFINSIPALATFSKPGFSTKGYEIKEGMILYHKKANKIYLDSIYIKGKSGNISGHGVIDLKKRVLDISLAIQVAKDFSKVISKIPLVGYIIMGDDESMTLGLKITGSFDKPKVTNTVAKDIISLPFRMLKRTFGGNS